MLTSIDVKLIINCLFLFSSANILQIADVVRRVAFLLVLAMFLAVKRVKCSPAILYSLPKQLNLVPRSSRLTI